MVPDETKYRPRYDEHILMGSALAKQLLSTLG